MKTSKTIFSTIAFIILILFISETYCQNVGTAARMHANKINLPLNNKGNIADVVVPDGGTVNGYYLNHEFLFSAGFFMGGFVNDTLWANGSAGAPLIFDYQPGIVGMDPDDPAAGLYKVNKFDPFGQGWQDWIEAVNLGADFYDGDHNGIYNPVDLNNNGVWDPDEDKPDMIGDENFWCVYNDGVPANERLWGCEPLGIEIRQTMFAYALTEELDDVVFLRYRIKNTGSVADTLTDVYFGNFADADIGEIYGFVINRTGVDTIRNADYTYMKNPSPPDWGNQPPCFMTDVLTGPMAYVPGISFEDINGNNLYDAGIDIPIDTAFNFRGPLGVPFYPGALNERLSSSIFYIGGDPALNMPQNKAEAYNNILGLNLFGNTADPCNWPYGQVYGGIPCYEVNPLYWHSGDPVSNNGWVATLDEDMRTLQSSGPFKLLKNKEIEILVAFEVGQGDSPLNSVTVARAISDEIQDYYENNFGYPYILDVNDKINNPFNYTLYQNYPNPFNPSTKIRYELPETQTVKLIVYDILGNQVKVLVNEEQTAGNHEIRFNSTGLSSGVYVYRILAGGFSDSKKMIILK